MYDLIKTKEIDLEVGNLDRFTENGIVISGKLVKADTVVFATGFQRDFFSINSGNEAWMYRNTILPGTTNFAVVGIINTYCNPMHTNLQAVWLSEVLRGRVCLPPI